MTKRLAQQLAEPVAEHLLAYRRYLHENPELSFQEVNTSRWVREKLMQWGIAILPGISGTSVVGVLDSGRPGPAIAFRADMDALPVQEQTGLPFASRTPNVMHACGHDGHTAILLAMAETLAQNRDRLRGKAVFLFQSSEEKLPGGAVQLVRDGALVGVDAVFGLHMQSGSADYETGKVVIKNDGPTFATVGMFLITVTGKGGHGGHPQNANNPIAAACTIASELMRLVQLTVDPRDSQVVSVNHFVSESGRAYNVIPETAEVGGNIRSLDDSVQEATVARIQRIVDNVCAALGCTGKFDYMPGYPCTRNDPQEADFAAAVVEELGYTFVHKKRSAMGGEDFSYYLQQVPGAYLEIGSIDPSRPETALRHHIGTFDFDERALRIGLECFLGIYLAKIAAWEQKQA